MQVEVRVYAGLEKHISGCRFGEPISIQLAPGATGRDLLKTLNIPENQVFSYIVNGVQKKLNDVLQNADRVALFPPIGGG